MNLNVIPYPITSQSHFTKYRALSFGPEDQKSGLRAILEGTEREVKERQGQNWPGKNLLNNFVMKTKGASFVFPNH